MLVLAVLLLVPSVSTAVSASHTDAPTPETVPSDGSATAVPSASPGPVTPASPGITLRGILAAAGEDPTPSPDLPSPDADRPLPAALEALAAEGHVDAETLRSAQDDAQRLPLDLQEALALLLLARAEAEDGIAPGDREANLERSLLLASAADAALPVLQRYALLGATGAHELPAQQAHTVDLVVALATGSQPLARSGTDGDLSGAVVDLYGALGVETTPQDATFLDAGSSALPDDVREAATVLVEGRTQAATLQAEALADLSPEERAFILTLEGPGSFGDAPSGDHLATERAYLDALGRIDHAKLAQADLVLATAALQSHAILEDGPREDADDSFLGKVWNGVKDLVSRLIPIGTARAQATQGGCPTESPLSDCGNDVWFMDPFGIVVVSGPRTTHYDDRYGQVTLSDRVGTTLKRLPTDDEAVHSRTVLSSSSTSVEGSTAREEAEDTTDRGAPATADETFLQRSFYAATLDMGGDDVYTHQTASTLDLTPFLAAIQRGTTEGPTVRELGDPFVENIRVLPDDVKDQPVPIPDALALGDQIPLLASVLVDVGGDDRYVPGTERSPHGTIASSSTLGMALLLDASGDDTYHGGDHSVGAASTLARAYLLDLDGNDDLRGGNMSLGAARIFSTAVVLTDCADDGDGCTDGADIYASGDGSQGWGSLGATGVLLDRGGTDTYELLGARGQGYGTHLGTGLLLDAGGHTDEGIRSTRGTTVGPGNLDIDGGVNHEYVAGTVWYRNGQGSLDAGNASAPTPGAGLALDLDHPAALDLDDDRGPVASVQSISVAGVDVPGLFSVDLVSDTTYSESYGVLVDLSGYDTYENGAASAASGEAALLLDLGGRDRYGLADATPRDRVQASADGGVALLADLGRSTDAYHAGNRSQGFASNGGVALLLDDGTDGDADTFQALSHAQGAATGGGFGALVTLQGATQYEASAHAQGSGSDAGVGVLVDRHNPRYVETADRSTTPGLPYAPHDTYEAVERSQGHAAAGGTGLLLDSWGDDTYRLSKHHGQGYAAPAESAPNGTAPTTALLTDLNGADRYQAGGPQVHGYAAATAQGTDAGNATASFLLDLHLPDIPLPTLADVLEGFRDEDGNINTGHATSPEQDTLPAYDITEHYDGWLRDGQGDTYEPARTTEDRLKEENSYWLQPRTDDPADATRTGMGMDNPPLAAYGLGFDAFTRNLTGLGLGSALVNSTVPLVTPTTDVSVHEPDDERCGDAAENVSGTVCIHAEVDYQEFSGDPDRHGEIAFYLDPEDDALLRGETVDRFLVATVPAKTYYDLVKNVTVGTVNPDAAEVECGRVPFYGYEARIKVSAVNVCFLPGVVGPMTVDLLLDTRTTCQDVNWTLPTCPRETKGIADAAAIPAGAYDVHVEARTTSTFLTQGRSVGEASTSFNLSATPQLLDVQVDHANPKLGEGASLNLVMSAPVRSYDVTIADDSGEVLAERSGHDWDGFIGTPRTLQHTREGEAVNRTVYEVEVPWSARDEDGSFVDPGVYRFDVRVNEDTNPSTSVHRLTIDEDTPGNLETLDLTMPERRSGSTLVWRTDSAPDHLYIIGGEDAAGNPITDVLVYDPSSDPLMFKNFSVDWSPVGGPPVGAVGIWREDTTNWVEDDHVLLIGGGYDGLVALYPPESGNDAYVRDLTHEVAPKYQANLTGAAFAGHTIDEENREIFLVGGRTDDGPSRDVFRVDLDVNATDPGSPPTNASGPNVVVTQIAKIPKPLSHPAVAYVSGPRLVVAGGTTGDDVSDAVYELPVPADGNWSDYGEERRFTNLGKTLPVPVYDARAFPMSLGFRLMGGLTEGDAFTGAVQEVSLREDEEPVLRDVEFPRYHLGTRVVQPEDGSYLVLGAGRWIPSDPAVGPVASDATPPEASFDVTSANLGCGAITCSAPDEDGNRTLHIPFTVEDDGSGIERIARTVTHEGTTRNLAPVTPGGDLAVHGTVTVPEVSHGDTVTVSIRAVDGAGNSGDEVTRTYTVDLRTPEVRTVVDAFAPHPGIQNRTVFPVGWDIVGGDVEQVKLLYRIPSVQTDWTVAATVPATGPDARNQVLWNASALGEAGNVSHGTDVEFEVLALDDAGNLQAPDAANQRTLTLDLLGPIVENLEASPDRTQATVSWSVTGEANLHTLQVETSDAEQPLRTVEGDLDEVAFDLEGLVANTTYDVTARSVDRAGHVSQATTSFTTNASLHAELISPQNGALLQGTDPVRFRLGAVPASDGGDPSVTWTLQAEQALPDGSTTSTLLASAAEVDVDAGIDDPAEPDTEGYPVEVDTRELADGNLTLVLEVSNDQSTVTSTRAITVDNTPPALDPNATTLLEGTQGPGTDDVPWFRGPVVLRSIPVTDAVSGVERVHYGTNDSGFPQTYLPGTPPSFDAEGETTVRYQAVDRAGNRMTSVGTASFGIDLTPPTVALQREDGAVVTQRNVTINVSAADALSGVHAVRVASNASELADAPWMTPLNGTGDVNLTLEDGDGDKVVAVEVQDAAGNTARANLTLHLATRPPTLVSGPSVSKVSPTSMEVTWTTDKPSLTAAVLVTDDGNETRSDPGFSTEHVLSITDLTPGENLTLAVILEDELGHRNLSAPLEVSIPDDGSPPDAPTEVTAEDTGEGAIVLSWLPSLDDTGVDHYVVERQVTGSDYEVLGNSTTTTYRDDEVPPGVGVTYRVVAVDHASNPSPPSVPVDAEASTTPLLRDPIVEVRGDPPRNVTLGIVVEDADGDDPVYVRALVNGETITLRHTAGNVRHGAQYEAVVNLTQDPLPLDEGLTIWFEANDGDTTVRGPADGPVTLDAVGDDGGPGGNAAGLSDVPAPGVLVLLAAAALVAVGLRARGRDR